MASNIESGLNPWPLSWLAYLYVNKNVDVYKFSEVKLRKMEVGAGILTVYKCWGVTLCNMFKKVLLKKYL